MYNPKHFSIEDDARILAFMKANSFAALITVRDGAIEANHLRFVVCSHGSSISLVSHVATANLVWRTLQANPEVLVIFHGPQAYISPLLYDTKLSVPSWNYA